MYDRRVRIRQILIVHIFDFVCASVGAWKKYTYHVTYFVARPARPYGRDPFGCYRVVGR